MRAIDVMTVNVITVDPDTSVQEVAQLLSERGISGVPVVDAADRLVGIVSEGDLLHRVETGTERRPERLTGRRSSHGGWTRSDRPRSLPATTSSRMAARQGTS
jgi:CBS domain-containing protein